MSMSSSVGAAFNFSLLYDHFYNNSCDLGGAVEASFADVFIAFNCSFVQNSARVDGGALCPPSFCKML